MKENRELKELIKAASPIEEIVSQYTQLSIIASACRKHSTGETAQEITASKCGEENTSSDIEIIACIEPADSPTGYVYTETIEVVNFIRRKAPKKNSKQE